MRWRFKLSLRTIAAAEERTLLKSLYAAAIIGVMSAASPVLAAETAKPKVHPRPASRPAPASAPTIPALALIASLLVAGTAIRRKGLTRVSA